MANVVAHLEGGARLFEVLPSAARTATPDTMEYRLGWPRAAHSGLILVIDATAIAATPSVTVTILGVDPLANKTYTILASAAITAVSTTVLSVGPGLPVTTNVSANALLPFAFRVSSAHGDADSITYSISGMLAG